MRQRGEALDRNTSDGPSEADMMTIWFAVDNEWWLRVLCDNTSAAYNMKTPWS